MVGPCAAIRPSTGLLFCKENSTPQDRDEPEAFPATCPNGHEVRPAFTVDELKAGQVEGTLQFHCLQCATDWKPTAKENAYLRRWLEEHST